jgi:hypothetical protein
MIHAYELESKVAKYPRVLVDTKLVSVARKAHARHHTSHHEARYVSEFLTKDTDGHRFIDYISWRGVVDGAGMDDDNYPLYLRDIGKIIAPVSRRQTRAFCQNISGCTRSTSR